MLSIVAHALLPGARPPSVRIQSVVGLMEVALAHLDSRIPAPAARPTDSKFRILNQVLKFERVLPAVALT
jgi:hypothetical protein